MNGLYLSDIYIYPIKSLGGIRLEQAQLEERGLKYDRRWMLIDEGGVFITQRKYPALALFQLRLGGGKLFICHKKHAEQQISFEVEEQFGAPIQVSVWEDDLQALEVNPEVSRWFSQLMDMNLRLVVMPAQERRAVDPRYATKQEIVSFADGYPCLIIGQASLDQLNQKLEVPVLMDRFRPNLVFRGGIPHQEDDFHTFYIGAARFTAVKPCARCVLITVDQQNGTKGAEPLKTLAGYRTFDKKVLFGQNLLHEGFGTLRIGDEIRFPD